MVVLPAWKRFRLARLNVKYYTSAPPRGVQGNALLQAA
jgi:hypothetical protein